MQFGGGENQGNNHIVKNRKSTEIPGKYFIEIDFNCLPLKVCNIKSCNNGRFTIIAMQCNIIFKKQHTPYGGEHSMNTRKS